MPPLHETGREVEKWAKVKRRPSYDRRRSCLVKNVNIVGSAAVSPDMGQLTRLHPFNRFVGCTPLLFSRVTPAKAGAYKAAWVPACAGMVVQNNKFMLVKVR
jgi:hypothetical protein